MPTRIIIQSASILTLDDSDTFSYPGAIEIVDDKIADIYSWPRTGDGGLEHASTADAIIIDETDELVMPGLVDLHFHTSVAKGYGDNLPLWEYLDAIWYPSSLALTPKAARTAALHSHIAALKSGTTTVNEISILSRAQLYKLVLEQF